MRWIVALAFVGLSLAGCIGDDTDDETEPATGAAERWSTKEWQDSLSQNRYEGYTEEIFYLDATDGTSLALTVYLPDGIGADQQVPTLLELTPYQALDRALNVVVSGGTGSPGNSWVDYVLRGAAFVRADARGTHGSEGCLDFGGTADRDDARIFTDWIRGQPWSNGVVVTDGVSHPGMGSVVAHVADPLLSGAITHAPVVSYYQDEWLQGAKFEDQINGYAYQAIELVPGIDTAPESVVNQAAACTGQTALDYAPIDGQWHELWQDRDLAWTLRGNYEEADTDVKESEPPVNPILLTHGFVDLNVHPDHSQMYWDALPDDYPKYVIWGWWYHGWPDMEGHPAETFTDWRHRWIDHLMFQRDNGMDAEPRVLVEDSQGTWHESHDWPIDGSVETVWSADGEGLNAAPGSAGTATYTDTLGAGRGVWTAGHVAFRSEPLADATLVNGAPVVDLVAESDVDHTKWVVYLIDEAPDGSWERISHGYADSHIRAPNTDEWVPMTPGQVDHWTIPMQPTAVVVEAGHRIVLVVASQDSRNVDNGPSVFSLLGPGHCWDDYRGGCYSPSGILPAPTMGRAVNTIHTGEGGTQVTFHAVDPETTAKPPTD